MKKEINKFGNCEYKDESWIKKQADILSGLAEQDLISDELFNFYELNLYEELGKLIKKEDDIEIKNYSTFIKLLEDKLETIYNIVVGSIGFLLKIARLTIPILK